jgi:hypothetical protein
VRQWLPCKRKLFVLRLRQLGFEGPFQGARHQFMIYRDHRLVIPSNKEYSVSQLKMMIREVEQILVRSISSEEWNTL